MAKAKRKDDTDTPNKGGQPVPKADGLNPPDPPGEPAEQPVYPQMPGGFAWCAIRDGKGVYVAAEDPGGTGNPPGV